MCDVRAYEAVQTQSTIPFTHNVYDDSTLIRKDLFSSKLKLGKEIRGIVHFTPTECWMFLEEAISLKSDNWYNLLQIN